MNAIFRCAMTVMMLFVTMTGLSYTTYFTKDGLNYMTTSNSNYTAVCVGWENRPAEVSIPPKVLYNSVAYDVVALIASPSTTRYSSHCGKLRLPATIKTVYPQWISVSESIEVEESSQFLVSLDGILYTADYKTLIKCPSSVTELVMPEETEIIGDYANCSYVSSIVFSNALTKIGEYAFIGSPLTSIVFPENLTEIGEGAFYMADLTSVTFSKIKRLDIIDNYAFYCCKGLTSIVLPDNLDGIDDQAFADCENLYSIVLPKSLMWMLGEVFVGCDKIREIYCRNPSKPYGCDDQGIEFEEEVYLDATLYVPIGSKHLYERVMPWRNFFNIQEWDFAGVESTMEQNEEQIEGIYSVEGIPISSDDKGIQIIKYSDGSVKKIIKR